MMKTTIQKLFTTVLCLALAVACFAGCAPDADKDKDKGKLTVTVSPTAATLYVGEEISLTATVTGQLTDNLTWDTSNAEVATVVGSKNTASVTAVGKGAASIQVKHGETVVATSAITVSEKPVDKLVINLPAKKLVLAETDSKATVKVKINDSSISESSLVWTIDKTDIATVEYQGAIAYVTAVSKGTCTLNVASGGTAASCEITVLKTVIPVDKSTKEYYVYNKSNERGEKTYLGLSNAINEIINNADYGAGSYITTVKDTETKVYTHAGKSYNFLTRDGVYGGFDTNANVTDGQANWWGNFYGTEQLDLFNSKEANMLQSAGGLKNSWYYRQSEILSKNGDVNKGWSGYRDSLYTAAGAGLNYATWADDTAYGLSAVELNYDLTGSELIPSKSEQSVYAEIYTRIIVGGMDDKTPYYGVYFDAGTTRSTADLEDGAKGYWYAFEGSMAYYKTDGMTYPLQSKRTLNEDTPVGYSVWNKSAGKWVTGDLKIKLKTTYHFTNETQGNPQFTADFDITGAQDGQTHDVQYIMNGGKAIDRSGVRFTYGVSFTPKAKLQSEINSTYGFYNNAEVPDLHNGGSWTGVRQAACIGYSAETGKVSNDLSFIGTGTRQYVSIWGTDVCTYKKDAITGTTKFDFQF